MIASGTVYPSTSLLHLCCLSSGHASRLISSPFPIPVCNHVQWSRSDTRHFRHSFMLLLLLLLFRTLTIVLMLRPLTALRIISISVNFITQCLESVTKTGRLFTSSWRHISHWPINARGIVILSHVRLQTFSPEVGDATALATVRAFVLTVRLAIYDTGTCFTLL